jgi:hypothetical protein
MFETSMSDTRKSLCEYFIDWVLFLGVNVRAAIASPLLDEAAVVDEKIHVDPDFERWLDGDLMVLGSAASRYRSQAPGYLTSNGRGSLEIGAAED